MCLAIDFSGENGYNIDMEKRVYKEENFKKSQWSGGTTTELAIYPDNTQYLNRDFMWRLSSADSDKDESSFTKLPDFDRILMVLEGSVILAHGEERTVELSAMEQDTFDGAVKTKCYGNLKKDYNLIMRKGCKGRMEVIDVEEEGKAVELTPRAEAEDDGLGGECVSLGFYMEKGYAVVSAEGVTTMVKEGEQMVINCQPTEVPAVSIMGKGKCVFTEIIFEKKELFSSEVTEARASAGDFTTALKISLGNNKWNKILRQARRKGEWYDPLLLKKLRFLDKTMITFIVWVIGTLLCLCTLRAGLAPGTVFAIFVAFSVVHLFLLRPLIYMIFLPKPISAHIKKQSELNAYEQKLFDEQLDYDERQEKLMYKYRDRSGEKYKGRRDFLRRLNKNK